MKRRRMIVRRLMQRRELLEIRARRYRRHHGPRAMPAAAPGAGPGYAPAPPGGMFAPIVGLLAAIKNLRSTRRTDGEPAGVYSAAARRT